MKNPTLEQKSADPASAQKASWDNEAKGGGSRRLNRQGKNRLLTQPHNPEGKQNRQTLQLREPPRKLTGLLRESDYTPRSSPPSTVARTARRRDRSVEHLKALPVHLLQQRRHSRDTPAYDAKHVVTIQPRANLLVCIVQRWMGTERVRRAARVEDVHTCPGTAVLFATARRERATQRVAGGLGHLRAGVHLGVQAGANLELLAEPAAVIIALGNLRHHPKALCHAIPVHGSRRLALDDVGQRLPNSTPTRSQTSLVVQLGKQQPSTSLVQAIVFVV